MRAGRVMRLMPVSFTCAFLLWAALLWLPCSERFPAWLLPTSQTVRASPGSLFVTVMGSGTACSQAQPCALQTALAQSAAGDILYVGAGTYVGSGAAVVTLTQSITLYGGWNGAAAGAVLRDPVAYRSILDGQGERRVVYAGPGITFTLDGFTIQRGNASGRVQTGLGGGIYSRDGLPIIVNNVITGNIAYDGTGELPWAWGGAIFIRGATGALIQDNQVLNNVANRSGDAVGGGIVLFYSDWAKVWDNLVLSNTASITNGNGYGGGVALIQSHRFDVKGNIIEGNRGAGGAAPGTGGRGGGVYIEHSVEGEIDDNRIRNNVANLLGNGYGGGVAAYWADSLWVRANVLEGNTAGAAPGAGGQGGALSVYFSSAVLIRGNLMRSNIANPTVGSGGAMWIEANASFRLNNNIVANNTAGLAGGGLALGANESTPVTGTLLHNTFVANDSGSGNGRVAVFAQSSWVSLGLVNNLFSQHTIGLCVTSGSSAVLTGTLFYANSVADTSGGGSITHLGSISGQDPLLDAEYRLRPGSPAIDAGAFSVLTEDIDGDPRPLGEGFDIGADEYREPRRVYLPIVLRK